MTKPLDQNYDSSARTIASNSDALTEDIVYMLISRGLNAQYIDRYAIEHPNDERLYQLLDNLEEDIAAWNNLELNRETWEYNPE